MSGFLGDVMAWFGALKVLLVYGAIGAVAALLGAVAYRMIGGATGLIVAACLGALVVGGTSSSAFLRSTQTANLQAQIDKLEAEKKAAQISLSLANASKMELEKAVSEAQETVEQNAEVMDQLQTAIEMAGDQCGISAEELDILRKLQ